MEAKQPLTFMEKTKDNVMVIGEIFALFRESVYCSLSKPFYPKKLFEQIVQLGIGSLSITVVIGFVTGLVMTLNFGYGLQKFGGTLYVPGIVILSITREMAPIFTSLLVAGRIGSGIAAELGSMNVTQQVDALRALGTSPVRILVVPRLLAAMISMPLLTCLSNGFGFLGSLLVSYKNFHISPGLFLNKVLETVRLHDLLSGLTKTMIFAIIIVLVACYRGFKTKDGTQGVGNSTTWVVVRSSILILVVDFMLTKIFLVYWIP